MAGISRIAEGVGGEEGVCDTKLPATMPSIRHKSRLIEDSNFKSPLKRLSIGSPTYYGSPSRLHTLFRCYTWREVKGHLSQTIGRGGFGTVHRANIHGFELAIKKMRYTLMNKKAILKSLQSEKLAVSMRHRNVVTIYHVNDRSDPAFVIMEYVGSHTLQQVIDGTGISKERVRHFAQDVATALDYIHSLRIVHLDVKPSNVLITNYNIAKLGDFGCAQKLHWDDIGEIISPTNRIDITGTVAYRAPELLRGCPPSTKADIYAYGILVWQMLSCKLPYCGKDNHMVIFSVVAHNLRPSISSLDSSEDDLVNLCQQCWSADPDQRPAAVKVKDLLDELITGQRETKSKPPVMETL